MENKEIVEICKKVLKRLKNIGYEKNSFVSSGQLIFPSKSDVKRISEQELKQLFIEVFIKDYTSLFYSIETPTVNKYSFTNEPNQIKVGDDVDKGQSALLDMCVFENEKEFYKRILNIEFKHKNATKKNISKDLLKLIHEEQNGAFILLLKNTDNGTLKSVLNKFSNSFVAHNKKWNGDKYIQLIILSLEEKKDNNGKPFLIHRIIRENSLTSDKNCFTIDNIESVLVSKVPLEDKWGKIII
ncbi:hypothetical protein [Lutibacter sp.]|uniref:hypothetical protein n=1 Tax=Lutibacter sp. TaxID=1925666 RepID=UPI003561D08A